MQLCKVLLVVQSIIIPLALGATSCATEDDLDFESCNLIDLSDEVLSGICNRIGLDMVEHVLPTIVDDEESTEEGNIVYTHEQYAIGAEECLMVEAEMDRLAEEDPEELERMEREAMADDPEILGEIIADVLEQDAKLLSDVSAKIKDAVEHEDIVQEISDEMLNEGEKLEDRPDVLGYLVATIIVEDHYFLDEFDEFYEEFDSEDWGENGEVGDEL